MKQRVLVILFVSFLIAVPNHSQADRYVYDTDEYSRPTGGDDDTPIPTQPRSTPGETASRRGALAPPMRLTTGVAEGEHCGLKARLNPVEPVLVLGRRWLAFGAASRWISR